MASPAYERRNARARALGYESYYDYRIHNHGRIAAGEPAPGGEARARLRGHRGAADLARELPAGSVLVPIDQQRDPATGRLKWVEVEVDGPDGSRRRYRLRGRQLDRKNLDRLWATIQGAGATWAHNPSVNLFAPMLELGAEAA